MFVVVRNTKSAQNNLDYKLNRGDIIKLGRIKFNVKDYKTKFINGAAPIPEEEEKGCDPNDLTPNKNCVHNQSLDSLTQEFEEEVAEIDCGVVDLSVNKDI